MAYIEESIDVESPIRTVYNQWTQFAEFPHFMEGVKEVRQIDDKRLFWRAVIAGKEVEWHAEITEQVPDQRIAWVSTSGVSNAGSVSFKASGPTRTRVTLRLDYDPEGVRESAAAALGIVRTRVTGDLERFKKFIESRGTETGAWRGEIHGSQIERPA